MSIYNIPAIKDTFVYNDKLAKPKCYSPYLLVGKISSGFFHATNYISYVYFDLSEIPENEVVTSAALNFYFFDPPLHVVPPEYIGIQLLAGSFKDCLTNYYDKPPVLPRILKIIPINHKSNYIVINVTNFVKAYLTGRAENYGFALVPIDKGSNGVLLFHGSNSDDKLKHPLLKVKTSISDPSKKIYKINREETHYVKEQYTCSSSMEIWNCSAFSFIVKNIGAENLLVKLQCSPDNKTFIDEEPEIELVPGQCQIMFSNFFIRYARLKFRLKDDSSGKGLIQIWAQGRQ